MCKYSLDYKMLKKFFISGTKIVLFPHRLYPKMLIIKNGKMAALSKAMMVWMEIEHWTFDVMEYEWIVKWRYFWSEVIKLYLMNRQKRNRNEFVNLWNELKKTGWELRTKKLRKNMHFIFISNGKSISE